MGRFKGMSVLITGAAGGFGLKLAQRFAAEGARLVLSDLDAGRLAEAAEGLGAETALLAGDIGEEALSQDLVALALSRFGGLDVAINNAGIVHDFAKLPQTPSDIARRVIEVDLLGVFFAMKHQIPAMEARFRETNARGAIVNIASVAGIAGEAELTRGVPMRRLAEPDEIAEVVLFAADPNNAFMTGQALAADGGITAI
jgi:NAD(P)-dependent dehydrogenase (short-subunit alcohol dehydrogenase family)